MCEDKGDVLKSELSKAAGDILCSASQVYGSYFDIVAAPGGIDSCSTKHSIGKEFNRKTDQGEHSLSGDFSSKSNLESSKESCSSLSLGLSCDQSMTSEFQSSKHSSSD